MDKNEIYLKIANDACMYGVDRMYKVARGDIQLMKPMTLTKKCY